VISEGLRANSRRSHHPKPNTKSDVEKHGAEKEKYREKDNKVKHGKFGDLIENIIKAERVGDNCCLLEYPDFKIYVFRGAYERLREYTTYKHHVQGCDISFRR